MAVSKTEMEQKVPNARFQTVKGHEYKGEELSTLLDIRPFVCSRDSWHCKIKIEFDHECMSALRPCTEFLVEAWP